MEQVDRQFEFHRLARSWPQYRWWKPLLTALLGVAFYLAFTVVLLIIGAVVVLATSADVEQYLDAAVVMDLSDPVIFAVTLASLILLIPALALATLIVGPKPLGLLSSVAGHIRWRWLAVCTVAALAVYLASFAVSLVLGHFFPEESAAAPAQHGTSTLLILLALSVLAVPFQAAAEEYVFRGFLMQAIGGWLRHPAFAILLPVPLFVLAHGYDPLGQTSIAIFAIFAGWISWRTGGLEAAIAVHAINNMTIFVLGAFGLADVNSSEGSVGGLVVSMATMAVTALVIVRLADRRGIERTRGAQEPVHPTPQPAYPYPAYAMAGAGGRMPFDAQPQVPAAYDPWAPGQAQTPPPGASGFHPSQYDPSSYGRYTAPAPQWDVVPAALAVPPAPPHPSVPTPSAPTPSAPTPPADAAPPASPVPPIRPTTPAVPAAPARDYSADRHPSGPAHPPGPGHPAGPGHPGSHGHTAASE